MALSVATHTSHGHVSGHSCITWPCQRLHTTVPVETRTDDGMIFDAVALSLAQGEVGKMDIVLQDQVHLGFQQ